MSEISDKKKKELEDKQWEIAMEGNVPMLIWLGKQHLYQADSHKTSKFTFSDEFDVI